MSRISSSECDENLGDEIDFNEIDEMIVPMAGMAGILVGEYALKYLCKQPCRTSELTGHKWVQEILHGNDR